MVVPTGRHRHRKQQQHRRHAGGDGPDEFRDDPSPDDELDTDAISLMDRFLFANDSDEDGAPSLGVYEATCFALSLDPAEVRDERIIMLYEAYTLFGALYINGVWILYEWGSAKAYGGDGTNAVVERIFELVMAVAFCCNVCVACFGAWFWILSILFASSHKNFVLTSRRAVMYLQYLLFFTILLVAFGIFLGIYLNLSPHWPETIVALAVVAIIFIVGMDVNANHGVACASLEVYHHPWWIKAMLYPAYCFVRGRRKELKERAKLRAKGLRRKAHESEKPNANRRPEDTNRSLSAMAALLRAAAVNLDREDDNAIHTYAARLDEDWLRDPGQLRSMSVDAISRYMPYGLAQEVQNILREEKGV